MIRFYKVKPISVVFFRDPKPFTAGEHSLARLQFPPRITPFLGALRTKFLEIKSKVEGKSIPDLFRDRIEDELKKISLFWFSLMKVGKPLIPVPFDAFISWRKLSKDRFVFEKDGGNQWVPLKKMEKETEKEPAYLTVKGFLQYLNGQIPSWDEVVYFDEIYQIENRVGLTLSKETKTSERSKFYRISVARLEKEVEFLVGVEIGDGMLPERFTTRLGGEGHIAVWEMTNKFEAFTENSAHFRELVALTHIPIKQDGNSQYEIKNWCINKLDIISGWDYKEHRPKPLRKVLKPGSVLSVSKGKDAKPTKVYKIEFSDSESIFVVKDLQIYIGDSKENGSKSYLVDFKPVLGEPNTLFIVKK